MLTPHGTCSQSVVLSAGIHGNETAPIEILNQLVSDLLASQLPLAVRLLVILGNPPAIRAGERYLTADINRMFGGRYKNHSLTDEARRAEILEQKVGSFLHLIPCLYAYIMIYIRPFGVHIITDLVCYLTEQRLIVRQCYVG